MPVRIDWYDAAKTILLVELSGKWTWEEFFVQQDHFNPTLDALTYDVDVITRAGDAGASNYVPGNSLTQMPIVMRRSHARIRLAALVTTSGLWLTIDPLLRRVSRQYAERIVVVRDDAEAFARIMARRSQPQSI